MSNVRSPNAAPALQRAARGRLRRIEGEAERLLTVREVANRLGVCTALVYRLCERGELVHVRVSNAIRVTPAAVAAFISRSQR